MADVAGHMSLDAVLKPSSIAVIGASRTAATIGHQILANLLEHRFAGPVFPINPKARSIHGVRAYPRVRDTPDPIDLAVIAVPRDHVLDVAAECGEAGVRAIVVITAGFREIGGDGVELERRLTELVRGHGMRMIGPNCMGVINTSSGVSMNATFAPVMPPTGGAAFVSQSGALGLSVLDYATEYGLGIAQFVSVGNKPDVSGNDLLLQWEQDDEVRTILMYVEDFGNPAKFREIATRVGRRKPIIVLKSGRSKVGARAASSHTGALAASNEAVDALLAQAGVLRATSVQELFDMAMAFTKRPPPRSRRSAVLTNSGGPGILAADAMEPQGLELVELREDTVARLRPLFPPEASLRNPLDMIASAQPSDYRAALEILLDDEDIDSVVSIFVPPLGVRQEDVAEAIVAAAQKYPDKPVMAVLMGRAGLPQGRAELNQAGIPAYIFPESAARALAARVRHRELTERTVAPLETLAMDDARAAAILECALAEGRDRLDELEALALIEACGIPTAGARLATDAYGAVEIARDIGFPVVVKIVSPQITHKSDVGGVITRLEDAEEVATAVTEMFARVGKVQPQATVEGVLVQRMVGEGLELIAGVTRDRLFGPLVMFGLGGIWVEAIGDVVFRVAPFDRDTAGEMLDGIRGSSILRGLRGRPPANRAALTDVLCRLSQLAARFPAIRELDINPLLATPEGGVIAVDARVSLVR